ncbi:MAG: hypothetical protein ACON41_05555 [Parvibaculales bacterium]
MSDEMTNSSSKNKTDNKQARLRQALRDNLKRRKQAAKNSRSGAPNPDKPRAV